MMAVPVPVKGTATPSMVNVPEIGMVVAGVLMFLKPFVIVVVHVVVHVVVPSHGCTYRRGVAAVCAYCSRSSTEVNPSGLSLSAITVRSPGYVNTANMTRCSPCEHITATVAVSGVGRPVPVSALGGAWRMTVNRSAAAMTPQTSNGIEVA